MFEVIIMGLFGLAIYVFARIMEKKPILPWGEAKVSPNAIQFKKKKIKKSKHFIELDQEPEIFQDLFSDIKEINNHMIRYHDNTFVLMAHVEPVNYFLLSPSEQEAIDVTFEKWTAQLNYHTQIYLQNRYVDLTEPIKEMQKNMIESEDLHENASQYGQSMLEDLIKWQTHSPRFETKRYLIFTYKVNPNEINAESPEELEERMIDKAFSELFRRMNTAKDHLRKARIEVELLTTEGIAEVLYHAFNRRKAIKNRFYDFGIQEMLSMYVTAEQDDVRIALVKEGLDHEIIKDKEEKDQKAS